MDKIVMTGMEFYGYHGLTPQEKELGQRFVVDVELYLDLEKAGKLDDREYTADYAAVAQVIKAVVEGPPCNLIEAAAEKAAAVILEQFPVQEVLIRVKKPQAPIPLTFESMAVEIRRRRKPS